MVKRLLLSVATVLFVGSLCAQSGHKLSLNSANKLTNRIENKQKTLSVKSPLTRSFNANSLAKIKTNSLVSGSRALAPQLRDGEDPSSNLVLFTYPSSNDIYAAGWEALAEMFEMPSWIGRQDYNYAIYIPANYAKGVIKTLRMPAVESKYENIKVWCNRMATDEKGYLVLPTTAAEADYCQDVDTFSSQLPGKVEMHEINLNEGYTIPEGGCFVGFSFTATGVNPVVFYGSSAQQGGFMFQYPAPDGKLYWDDFAGYGIGNLAAQAIIDVTNCPQADVSVYGASEVTSLVGKEGSLTVQLYNNAAADVNSISCIITTDGVPSEEQTLVADEPMTSGSAVQMTIPFNFAEEGMHTVSVEVTKVNGETNLADDKLLDVNVVALEKGMPRISLVEQFTGTWCGYCPRGHVGMEKLQETYGDSVIVMSGHYVDPMQSSDYMSVMAAFSNNNFPSAAFDRCAVVDPYLGVNQNTTYGLDFVYTYLRSTVPSEGSISLTADWADDAKTSIKATANYTFNYDRFTLGTEPYGIAFFLVEDGMTGEDKSWLQYNYYSGDVQWGNDDMMWWVSQSDSVKTAYNDVVVAAWDALEGADNSVAIPIYKGETLPYETTLSIANNRLIQDKNNLKLVAALINRNNYQVVNAAAVVLGTPDAIESVATDSGNVTEVARYNTDGMLLAAPQKGINIVKYSDGTSKKVVVK